MRHNPYEKYKSNAVNTASREELTLMLYDGAVKFSNQALAAMQEKDHVRTNELITKVQNIIREFQITLDRTHDIANQLDLIYDYLHRRLVEANIKKDADILTEVRDHVRSLRDTWKEAMKLARQESSGAGTPASNVARQAQ